MAALVRSPSSARWTRLGLVAGAAALALGVFALARSAEGQGARAEVFRVPAAAMQGPRTGGPQTAVLSGGCFWGMQGVFEHVRGVTKVVAGYSGGAASTARYGLVSTGTTGHAESVEIVFDPAQISYGEILRIFFSVASDPTQVGGQYPDEGSQYRSEIFYANPAQAEVARRYIAQLEASKTFPRPIATRVDPLKGFYPAERYHQDYLVHHPTSPYIATYDEPKIRALKALFPVEYRPEAVLTLASR